MSHQNINVQLGPSRYTWNLNYMANKINKIYTRNYRKLCLSNLRIASFCCLFMRDDFLTESGSLITTLSTESVNCNCQMRRM